MGDEQEASGGKAGMKGKFNSQHMKYMRQRMQGESRILSSKLMAKQAEIETRQAEAVTRQAEAEARSQGCLSKPPRSPPMHEEEIRADYYL
jgi:hypothetical protein